MVPVTASEEVLILDFGSQYTQLIGRRIREAHVYSEILPFYTPIEELRRRQPKGLVLSGGPNSVYDDAAPQCSPEVFEMGDEIAQVIVDEVPAELEDTVEQAADECPVEAIVVE